MYLIYVSVAIVILIHYHQELQIVSDIQKSAHCKMDRLNISIFRISRIQSRKIKQEKENNTRGNKIIKKICFEKKYANQNLRLYPTMIEHHYFDKTRCIKTDS
jgi:hypothetical protein